MTHRDNLEDMVDFVRLVASLGASHAVFSNIAVHVEGKLDLSIYWQKDRYNELFAEASTIGTQLGIRVEGGRFYTSVQLATLDLEQACRDPFDVAYINDIPYNIKYIDNLPVGIDHRTVTAPCCQWTEDRIELDVFSDINGFERYWNNDLFRRLRRKRDLASCKVCQMTLTFDELRFHFSPGLKNQLLLLGRISDAETNDTYADHNLVKACLSAHLDLPSLRYTFTSLGLSVDHLSSIERDGLAALPDIDQICWNNY